MNVTTHDIGLESLDALSGVDTVCLFIPEDERPLTGLAGYVDWRLNGSLSRLLMGDFFRGALNDTVLMPADERIPAVRIFAVGLGPKGKLAPEALEVALGGAAQMLNRAKVTGVALEPPGSGVSEEIRISTFRKAFLPSFQGDRLALFADKNLTKHL